jgi:hypothetical protein
MRPRIDPLDDGSGLEILDPIESNRYVLYTSGDVSPTPTGTEAFVYPVSVARRIETSELGLPYNVPVSVRDARDGSLVLDVGHDGTHALESDEYLLEISGPVKLYVRVSSSLRIDATKEGVRLALGGPTPMDVGARSFHTSPASTVTVSDDPEDVMAAVSTFGSVLKTTTCERSWPTLRGHPPRVERGDELAIPDDLTRPNTGVTLHLPADYEHVFTVPPLAYYLSAEVVPDETPRLTTDAGFVHRFDTDRGFEDEVIRVLKQVFVLDCVTRTEGFHPMDLHERRAVESVPATDLNIAELYDAPLSEQLAAYLSIPYSELRDAVPPWNRVTHVRPTAEGVELLPYVANDLSLVRVRSPERESPPTEGRATRTEAAVNSFKRGRGGDAPVEGGRRRGEGGQTRGDDADFPAEWRACATGVPDSGEYVPLPDDDAAMTRAWVGDGTPVHGAKLHAAAFDHARSEPTDGVIDVTVVCNDEEMREEWDAVSEVYGTRDVVPFDVDCRFDVATDELRDLLVETHDVFHFVGHIDGRGFQCPDGILDAETVEETGATTVLLNACRSHDQGVALVEAGARAAIVSWGDVDNLGAVEVGETFARLLNYGFDVGDALEVVEEYTSIGRHYVVVGDPGVTVAQCVDTNPYVYELDRESTVPPRSGDEVETTVVSYATRESKLGTASKPYLQSDDDPDFYLVPGPLKTFTNTGEELREILHDYSAPVVVDGELRWSDRWYAETTK